VLGTVTVGSNTQIPTYDSTNGYVYVTNYGSGTVSVIQTSYSVIFTESGLPNGATWYVNVTGQSGLSATVGRGGGTQLSIDLPDGSYSYGVTTNEKNWTTTTTTGSFTVSESPTAVSVSFTPTPTSSSSFGLPWWIYAVIAIVIVVIVVAVVVVLMRRKPPATPPGGPPAT
jgi:hypothetical protein